MWSRSLHGFILLAVGCRESTAAASSGDRADGTQLLTKLIDEELSREQLAGISNRIPEDRPDSRSDSLSPTGFDATTELLMQQRQEGVETASSIWAVTLPVSGGAIFLMVFLTFLHRMYFTDPPELPRPLNESKDNTTVNSNAGMQRGAHFSPVSYSPLDREVPVHAALTADQCLELPFQTHQASCRQASEHVKSTMLKALVATGVISDREAQLRHATMSAEEAVKMLADAVTNPLKMTDQKVAAAIRLAKRVAASNTHPSHSVVARWTGQIQIQQAGLHAFFFTSSDTAPALWIDGVEVVPVRADTKVATGDHAGTVLLTEGLHDFVVVHFSSGSESEVVWKPPGGAKTRIPPQQLMQTNRKLDGSLHVNIGGPLCRDGVLSVASTPQCVSPQSSQHDIGQATEQLILEEDDMAKAAQSGRVSRIVVDDMVEVKDVAPDLVQGPMLEVEDMPSTKMQLIDRPLMAGGPYK